MTDKERKEIHSRFRSIVKYIIQKQINGVIDQDDVAHDLGMSKQLLSMLMVGRNTPTVKHLLKLKQVFNVSPNYILIGTGKEFLTQNG